MPSALQTILPVAVLGLRGVYAQASINFYSKAGCKVDYSDPESLLNNIQVYGQDKSDDDLSCYQTWWASDDWPTEEGSGRHTVWIEHAGIEDGCKLMLYEMTSPDPEVERGCVSKYVTFGDTGSCSEVTLPATYGYRQVFPFISWT